MAFPDRKTVDIMLTALLFVTALGVIYLARTVLIVFCFSILFAYLIDPIVSVLDRYSFLHRRARGIHIAAAYLGILILLGLTISVLVPQATSRPREFLRNIATFGDRWATVRSRRTSGIRLDGARSEPCARSSSLLHIMKRSKTLQTRSRVWARAFLVSAPSFRFFRSSFWLMDDGLPIWRLLHLPPNRMSRGCNPYRVSLTTCCAISSGRR